MNQFQLRRTPPGSPPRLIGGLPPRHYTGCYPCSTGFADELQSGFDSDDLQGLNAPEILPSGGMTTYRWSSSIDGSAMAMLDNAIRRHA